MPRRDNAETRFQIQVAGFLAATLMPPAFFFHCPNGGYRTFNEAANFKKMGVKAGVPDLAIVLDGRAYWIELKREKGGALNANQKIVQPLLIEAGCPAPANCRTLEEVKAALERWRIPLRRVSLGTERIIGPLQRALADPHAFDVVTE